LNTDPRLQQRGQRDAQPRTRDLQGERTDAASPEQLIVAKEDDWHGGNDKRQGDESTPGEVPWADAKECTCKRQQQPGEE
jgi:hypothetical protein